jgi:hypothetical protein
VARQPSLDADTHRPDLQRSVVLDAVTLAMPLSPSAMPNAGFGDDREWSHRSKRHRRFAGELQDLLAFRSSQYRLG